MLGGRVQSVTEDRPPPRTQTMPPSPALPALSFGAPPLVEALHQRIAASLQGGARADEPALVIGVFGEWGSGKSRLLRALKDGLDAELAQAQQDAFPAAYTVPVWFNAWRYEREPHLVIPLLKTAYTELQRAFKGGRTKSERFQDAAEAKLDLLTDLTVSLAQSLDVKLEVPGVTTLKATAPWDWFQNWKTRRKARGEAATAPVTKLESLQYDLHQHLLALTGRHGELFKPHLERVRSRARRKEAWTVTSNDPEWQRALDFKLNLVFFIDDLDRCLPDKAVEMLEAIKLFLEVEGCTFVLALDDEVVERGIAHRYRDYLFQSSGQAPDAARAAPITGAEYLEKIIQLPVRLTRPSKRQIEQFLQAAYPAWCDDLASPTSSGTGLPGPGAALRRLLAEVVPPVPRKLIRTIELMQAYEGIVAGRDVTPDRRMLALLVVLQLFAPELFRFLRRRGADLLDTLVQWDDDGELADLMRLERRLARELARSRETTGVYFRESKAALPALVRQSQHNRAGFDLRGVIAAYRALAAAERQVQMQRYFVLFSDHELAATDSGGPGGSSAFGGGGTEPGTPGGLAIPASSAPGAGGPPGTDPMLKALRGLFITAHATRQLEAIPWLPARATAELLPSMHQYTAPSAATLENAAAFVDGVLAQEQAARANAFTREAHALNGRVLSLQDAEPLLAGSRRFLEQLIAANPEGVSEMWAWLQALSPYANDSVSISLYQTALAALPASTAPDVKLDLAEWVSRQAVPAWGPWQLKLLPGLTSEIGIRGDQAPGRFLRGWPGWHEPASDPAWQPVRMGARWMGCPTRAGASSIHWMAEGRLACVDHAGQLLAWQQAPGLDAWVARLVATLPGPVTSRAAASAARMATVDALGRLQLWDFEDEEARTPLASLDTVALGYRADLFVLSPTGRKAVFARGNELLIHDLLSPSPETPESVLREHTGEIRQLLLGQSGMLAATRADDGTVRLWNLLLRATHPPAGLPNLIATWHDLPLGAHMLALDERTTSVTCVDGDKRLLHWSAEEPSVPPTISAAPCDGRVVASPLGDRLISLGGPSMRQPAHVWAWTSGHPSLPVEWAWARTALMPTRLASLNTVAFDSSGTFMATVDAEARLRVWRWPQYLEDGESEPPYQLIDEIHGARGIDHLAFSSDSKTLAGITFDGEYRVWRIGTSRPRSTFAARQLRAERLQASPDGSQLVSNGPAGRSLLWLLQPRLDTIAPFEVPDFMSAWFFSQDGCRGASVSYDGYIRVWDWDPRAPLPPEGGGVRPSSWLMAGQPTLTLRMNSIEIRAVAFSGNGQRLLSVAEDGTLAVWAIEQATQAPLATIRLPARRIEQCALDATGRRAAVVHDERGLIVWDVDRLDGEPLRAWLDPNNDLLDIAFSPDGSWLVAHERNSLRAWNLPLDGPGGLRFAWHSLGIREMQLSANGAHLVTASHDGHLRLWGTADTGIEPPRAEFALPPAPGHDTSRLGPFAISPDSRWLAATSLDGLVAIWRLDVSDDSPPIPPPAVQLTHPQPLTWLGWQGSDLICKCTSGWFHWFSPDPGIWQLADAVHPLDDGSVLRLDAEGVSLERLGGILATEYAGHVLPCDPAAFGRLIFHAEGRIFDAQHLADRLEWRGDGAMRVRWADAADRDAHLPHVVTPAAPAEASDPQPDSPAPSSGPP